MNELRHRALLCKQRRRLKSLHVDYQPLKSLHVDYQLQKTMHIPRLTQQFRNDVRDIVMQTLDMAIEIQEDLVKKTRVLFKSDVMLRSTNLIPC